MKLAAGAYRSGLMTVHLGFGIDAQRVGAPAVLVVSFFLFHLKFEL